MKIKIWDRLILLLGSLLAIASGVLLFVQGLQIKSALHMAFAVLTAAFGGYLIVFLRRCSAKRQDFVIQRTDNGELRIAVKAIENQVQKCVDLHEEIQSSTMKIVSGREGVVVDLAVTLDNNISIPLAVASLQKQIKQYLVASSGIEVKEVRVSVESTQDSSPAGTPEPEAEQPCEKAAAKEKKAPLHQRLFGREDEPAIVPEPPKEEEGLTDEEAATEAETEEAAEMVEERYQQAQGAEAQPENEAETFFPEAPVEAPETENPSEPDGPDADAETVLPSADAEEESEEPQEIPEEVPVLRDIPEEGFAFAAVEPEDGLEQPSETDAAPEAAETEEKSDE